MPPERHSGPARPPRDRYSGPPSFGPPRRSFGGPPGGHSGPPREGGPRPPFPPRPGFSAPTPAQPSHSVRLRDGDREVEVSGTPEFIRATLDDLPALLARLHGETPAPTRPASISMPPPPSPAAEIAAEADRIEAEAPAHHVPAPAPKAQRANGRVRHGRNGAVSLEDRVFEVLGHADHPLSVAGIRKQLGGTESGQQIRRILERAADRVYTTDERPAAYALR